VHHAVLNRGGKPFRIAKRTRDGRRVVASGASISQQTMRIKVKAVAIADGGLMEKRGERA
jgi:hypothetical protein